LKNRSLPAQLLAGLLLASAALSLTACGNIIYREPEYNYSGRPIPPSGLLERVMAAYTANGSSGGLEILDGLRDIRSNVQNTIPAFSIKGFSSAQPVDILNFPEQTTGYVLSYTDGGLINVNYSTESSSGSAASFGPSPPSAAAAPTGIFFAGTAEQSGALIVSGSGTTVGLNLPNVNKVVINQGGTVILAMVRNSNSLYRVVKLPATSNPVLPPGYIDCEPLLLPVFCVVPVGNTNSAGVAGAAYDRPSNAVFSLDGNNVYILNCGPECGGSVASVTVLQEGALVINNIPTVNPLTVPAPLAPIGTPAVPNPIPVPGGVTAAVSDGTYLYLAGQQILSTNSYAGVTGTPISFVGDFAGNLSLLNLSTYTVGAPILISDGSHTKILLADDNTLWIGASQCSNGARATLAADQLAAGQATTQAANYNCLTMVQLPSATIPALTAQIIPAVTQVPASLQGVGAVPVPYPNTNLNQYYYGNLTGLCWVQNYDKVYTAYGGQIHLFSTIDGSEINNYYVTIQGTVLDVAYMDAESNSAD